MKLTDEEATALGEDLHRHQELDAAIGELIQEAKFYAKRCGICMGPCPVFIPGAKPCRLVPPNHSERYAEMHEMLTELINIRKSRGLPNSQPKPKEGVDILDKNVNIG